MALLLTVIAVVSTCVLLASGIGLITRVTPTDRSHRGGWGIADWQWDRTRPLDAHERRWQTALLTAKRQDSGWRDLVALVRQLERSAEIPSDPNPPDELNEDWLRAQLERLEAAAPAEVPPIKS